MGTGRFSGGHCCHERITVKITKRQLRRIIREFVDFPTQDREWLDQMGAPRYVVDPVATPYYDYGYSDSERGHDPVPPDAASNPAGYEQYMAGYNAADEQRYVT
jgi:hypothetical protein